MEPKFILEIDMSQFNSQVQISDSENRQHSPVSTPHSPQNAVLSHESSTANGEALHVTYVAQSQVQTPVDTPVELNHPTVFFYRPPNDFYHYRVNCKEISSDIIESLLKKLFNDKENITQLKEDEYIFFYKQNCNNRFYQVSCEIVSPLLVNSCLSKTFLGIELQQNMGLEHLAFTSDQKEYLEQHLKQYLNQYFLN